MSAGRLRPAGEADLDRLWPAVKAARLFKNRADFEGFWERGPWRVSVAESGRAAVVQRWRSHLGLLAIRALWCGERDVPEIVGQLAELAARQGFTGLLSPLVVESASAPYVRAGMHVRERVVVMRANVPDLSSGSQPVPQGLRLRRATESDIVALLHIDEECFGDFWRYGIEEFAEYMTSQRLVVGVADDRVVGYSLAVAEQGAGTLGRLAVASSERRRGIGTALLRDAVNWMVRAGAVTISLCTQETNAASRALYARFGLREQRERLFFLAGDTHDLG